MSGIALIFDKTDKIDLEFKIRLMTNQLYHRGPDYYGYHIDSYNHIALGHRNLSVSFQLSQNYQPMFYNNNNLSIIFDGEIYNYLDIKNDLVLKGYSFSSETDTEVILASYSEWKENCVKHFNGMWAFVIFDKSKKKIFCSRDKVGIKPLYFAEINNSIYLASEIKAILAAGITANLNYEGLNEYFSFQNIISNNTLFENIKMIPSGNNLIIDIPTGKINIEEYWDLKFVPEINKNEEEYIKELKYLFNNSIQQYLTSKSDIGISISGGMDSSAITSVASKFLGHINTFTGYFNTAGIDSEDRSYSELDDARIISNVFNTIHHERLIVPQDLMNTLPSIIWHLEDPKVGMCYTFFILAQLISQKVKINLSGTGGDELFAGYPWRYNLIFNKEKKHEFDSIYYDWWCRLIKDSDKKTFFTKNLLDKIDDETSKKSYEKIINKAEIYSPINKALYFEFKTFLHGFLLVEDKLGMAYSIESRFPFLDNSLLDFIQKVPDNLKFKNGISKYLLKKAFTEILPDDIIYKRKQGFTPPDRTWYRRELKYYIESLLLSNKTIIYNFIEKKAIQNIINIHNNGIDKRFEIWSLIFFEGWCRTFLRGDIVSSFLF